MAHDALEAGDPGLQVLHEGLEELLDLPGQPGGEQEPVVEPLLLGDSEDGGQVVCVVTEDAPVLGHDEVITDQLSGGYLGHDVEQVDPQQLHGLGEVGVGVVPGHGRQDRGQPGL